ncbi:barstar family protein [Spirosoma sp. BT702]|uniref:Barstar family protein n=1 Tax=Spirosoma profusum TaxID=2771354 RepID=A0A926XXR6_9BACT|nr:barstar family protein [Spirosoma profusum]MBD2699932.1 barstar family protein [Spirosoma profusum]
MKTNVLICGSESELEAHFSEDFIAHIDGKKTLTLRQFYEEIAELLEIPDFGFTLDSLSDSLNDLQWLEENRIVLYFTNTDSLISKERDPAKIGALLSVLDATAEDWKWVDESENIEPKEIIIVFENSERIRKFLGSESIECTDIASLM